MSFQLSSELNENKVFLVNYSEVSKRLDCSHYKPEFRQFYEKLLSLKKILKPLGHYSKVTCGPFGSSITTKDYISIGIPLIRISNIDSNGKLSSKGIVFISKKIADNMEPYKVHEGDIVVSQRGSLGLVSVVPKELDGAVISANLIAIKNLKSISHDYLQTIIATSIGQVQISRQTSGQVQTKITTNDIKALLIPVFEESKQQEIVKVIDLAYIAKKQKEAEAQQLLDSIDDYLLTELGIELPEQEENTVQSRIFTRRLSDLSGGRFDPDYFQKHYRKIQHSVQSGFFDCKAIKEVTDLVINGNTPASKDYSDIETDYPIIKVKSYKGAFISLKKVDFTIEKKDKQAKLNDIYVLSAAHQASYVGRFLKFLDVEPTKNASFVGELICIRANNSICNPMYLFSLLNMEIYKVLLNREKTGQTSHIYPSDIKHINIPFPSLEKQTEIANHITDLRNQTKQLQQQAKTELEQAKNQVEAMILGEA